METPRQIIETQKTYSSLQEIFDDSYTRIIKQGKPGVDDVGVCTYRSPDNRLGCAIGVLISDETLKNTEWSGYQSIGVISGFTEALGAGLYEPGQEARREKSMMNLLVKMQVAHDHSVSSFMVDDAQRNELFLSDFKIRMAEVAKNFDLTVPEMNNGI